MAYAVAHGLGENVVVLDDKEAASLSTVTDSELLFNNPSKKLDNLQPGDVIIFETTPNSQSQAISQLMSNQNLGRVSNQFLVVATEFLNNNLRIKYKRPTLTDLLPDIDESLSVRPVTIPVEFSVPVNLKDFSLSGSLSLEVQKLNISIKGRKIRSSNPVTPPKVNGLIPVIAIPSGLCLEASLTKIEVCREWYVFERYDFDFAYELEASTSYKFTALDRRVFDTITPVFSLGLLDVVVGVDLSLNGSASIDVAIDQKVEGLTRLQDVNGFLLPVTTSSSTSGEASIDQTFEAEVILEPYAALTDRFWVAHAWTGVDIGIAGGLENMVTERNFDVYLDFFAGWRGGVRLRKPFPEPTYTDLFIVGEKDNIFRTSILRKSKLGITNFDTIPKNYTIYWRMYVVANGSKNVFASQYTTVPSKTRLEVWVSRNDKGNLVEEDYLPVTLSKGCTSLNGTSKYPKAALIDGLRSKEICELTVVVETNEPDPTPKPPTEITGAISSLSSGTWRVTPYDLNTQKLVGTSAAVTNGSFTLDIGSLDSELALSSFTPPGGVTLSPTDTALKQATLLVFDDADGNSAYTSGETVYLLNDPENTFPRESDKFIQLWHGDRAYTVSGRSETTTGSTVNWNISAPEGWARWLYGLTPDGSEVAVTASPTLTDLNLRVGRRLSSSSADTLRFEGFQDENLRELLEPPR